MQVSEELHNRLLLSGYSPSHLNFILFKKFDVEYNFLSTSFFESFKNGDTERLLSFLITDDDALCTNEVFATLLQGPGYNFNASHTFIWYSYEDWYRELSLGKRFIQITQDSNIWTVRNLSVGFFVQVEGKFSQADNTDAFPIYRNSQVYIFRLMSFRILLQLCNRCYVLLHGQCYLYNQMDCLELMNQNTNISSKMFIISLHRLTNQNQRASLQTEDLIAALLDEIRRWSNSPMDSEIPVVLLTGECLEELKVLTDELIQKVNRMLQTRNTDNILTSNCSSCTDLNDPQAGELTASSEDENRRKRVRRKRRRSRHRFETVFFSDDDEEEEVYLVLLYPVLPSAYDASSEDSGDGGGGLGLAKKRARYRKRKLPYSLKKMVSFIGARSS